AEASVDSRRSLASSHYQEGEGRFVQLGWDPEESLSYGVPGYARLGAVKLRRLLEAYSCHADYGRQKAICKSGKGIGLHQQGRDVLEGSLQHDRARQITSHPQDNVRLHLV